MQFMIGQTIDGKYKISDHLGRGGMADVYKATHINLGRPVAIKMMHPFLATEDDFKKRFRREARHMAALRHPNIVGVFDFEVSDQGLYYLVMEYIDGGSLRDRLQEAANSAKRISLAKAIQIALEVGDALDYAHQQGMVHRDIKPANIMLNGKEEAILTDFGIAKMMSGPSFTQTGTLMGTPAYMSPEQGLGLQGDERSDLYALGILLFQMLTGKLPFDAPTPVAVVYKHINDAIPDLNSIDPELPDEICAVVVKAMAKDPEQRFQTAKVFTTALREAINAQGTELTNILPAEMLVDRPTPLPVQTIRATADAEEFAHTEVVAPITPSRPQNLEENVKPLPQKDNEVRRTRLSRAIWITIVASFVGFIVIASVAAIFFFGPDDVDLTTPTQELNPEDEELPEVIVGITPSATPTETATPTTTPPPTRTNTPPPTNTFTPTPTPAPSVTPMAGDVSAFALPNGGQVEMIFIPAGSFTMGNESEIARADEAPEHTVQTNGYWIDKTEVTNAQFQQFVAQTGYVTTAETEGDGTTWTDENGWGVTENASWSAPFGPDSTLDGLLDHPVILVSWFDAFAYCAWRDARLPSESEWERAARGPANSYFPWGDVFDNALLNYCGQSCLRSVRDTEGDDGFAFTSPVGSFSPAGDSGYGLHDMLGNVWEWTSSIYAPYPYNSSSQISDVDALADAPGALRISYRGRSWFNPNRITGTFRDQGRPEFRGANGGFRCAMDELP